MLACQLQADPIVNWVSDSYGSFDVILTGTGPGWTGDVTSPSGLWELHSGNIIQYPNLSGNPNLPPVMIDNYGSATFLGPLPSQFPALDPLSPINTPFIGTEGGYMQFCDPATPINGENPMNYGYLCELSFYGSFQNWVGASTLSITSIPDTSDPSTWTWAAEYSAVGQSLEAVTPVPEPSPVSLGALAVVLGMVSYFFRSWQPARSLKLAMQKIKPTERTRRQRF